MNEQSPNKSECPRCGTQLGLFAPEGECPRCMLAAALPADESDRTAELGNRNGSGGESADPGSQLGAIRFGDYELFEEIGRGGMGVVHKARQTSLNRTVALKLLLFSATTIPDQVKRFRTEASAAASLQHPNIVAIHEVGVHQDQHYLAMDFVEGQSLARAVAAGPLPSQRAAHYVQIVAEAIEYAHRRGILHRDLKPSNILIDSSDQPQVTDFGLAKRLEGDSSLTLSGQVLGSPNYMPPEQADGRRGKVGRYSDVYALGATLYHLVTGRAPFVAATMAETLQQVQDAEPVSPTVLNPHVPRDLKTICLKCLEKEPARRYPTAQELADDLGRWLRKEPILARPIGPAGKAWRWCRRKPLVASLIGAIAIALLTGLTGVLWEGRQARAARDLAQGRLYAAQMKLAHAAFQEGKTGGALALLRATRPANGEPDFRGFEWRYLYRLCLNSPGELLASNAHGYQSVDYSPAGRTVAFGNGDGYVEIFDRDSRQLMKRWRAHPGPVDCLKFHPGNSDWLATVSGDEGIFKLWDVPRETLLVSTHSVKGEFADFAFSPSGRFLATRAASGRSIDLWEVSAGVPAENRSLTLRTSLPFSGPATFSPDERTLALCNQADTFQMIVALYDLAHGNLTRLPEVHANIIMAAAFTPDGNTLATGGADERLVLWDVRKRVSLWSRRSDFMAITSLAFTPDGRTLLTSSYDQTIRSWIRAEPSRVNFWPGHSAAVNRLAVAPDGRSFASASDDGTARIWRLAAPESASSSSTPEEFTTLFSPEHVPVPEREKLVIFAVAVSPAQDKVVADENHRLISCDLRTGVVLANVAASDIFPGEGSGLGGVAFSPDGRQLAVGSENGRVALLETAGMRPLKAPMNLHRAQVTHVAFALDGAMLVTGGGFGSGITLTDVATGRIIDRFDGIVSHPLQPLAVSPDGRRLAAGSPEGRVNVWDLRQRRVVAKSPETVRFLVSLAYTPDGQLVAFGDHQGVISLWDLSGRRPVRKLVGHAGEAHTLAFSPDGRTLASAGMDHTIRLWHPGIDQEVAILKGHSGWVWSIAFADHGNAILSGGADGTLRLWRALTFEEIETKEKAAH